MCITAEEEEPCRHRWMDTKMNDTENNLIVSHVCFESKLTSNISHKFIDQVEHRRMSDVDYDDGGNMSDKYSFPYTG